MLDPALPPGYRVRPALPADAVAAHALTVAHHTTTASESITTLAEVVSDLSQPSLDAERDTWLVLDRDEAVVMYAIAYVELPGRTFVDVYVAPTLSDSDGVALASWALRAGTARAADVARANGLDATIVETGMVLGDEQLSAAADATGFAPARRWWRMVADAQAISTATASPVPGVAVVAVDPDDDAVLSRVCDLRNESFADHYGNQDLAFDSYRSILRSSAGYDRTGLWVAVDDATGEWVGLCLCNDSRLELGLGYVAALGVLSSHRGRGLGRQLLLTAFAEYARRGRTGVSLAVDTDNATGAGHLYESVGMTVDEVIETWERAVVVEGPAH